MDDDRLTASAILRVLHGRHGLRIQVLLLGRDDPREFRSWAAALRYVHRASDRQGLR